MDVHTNIPLKNYTTMRLGGNARFMTEAHTPSDIQTICISAQKQQIPIFVLGGGSNVIVRDTGFNGIVIRNRIAGFEIIDDDPTSTTLKIGAGENWDDVVKRTVDMNLSGIEAMSAIPGTAGAAPVQNVGAYGQEIAETLISLEAYDLATSSFVTLTNADCGFSYRHSIFRSSAMGRYIITSITIQLFKSAPQPPFYAALQKYLDENSVSLYTPQVIRDAVTAIRAKKLPNPELIANTGSFFKNALIEEWQMNDLRKEFPDIPSYDMPNNTHKIPTGWLIEQAGLKGQLLHGMRVYEHNALVLVNESAANYSDLASARDEIIGIVRDKFRVAIEQEPLEI